jgi:hypothetical protein
MYQANFLIYSSQILTSARAIKRRLRRTGCDRTMEAIGASLAWTCLAHTLRDKIDEWREAPSTHGFAPKSRPRSAAMDASLSWGAAAACRQPLLPISLYIPPRRWQGRSGPAEQGKDRRRRAGQAAAVEEGQAGQARTRRGASWSGNGRARWYGPPPEPVCLKAVVLLTDSPAAEHEQKTGSIESLKPVRLGREIKDGKSNWLEVPTHLD